MRLQTADLDHGTVLAVRARKHAVRIERYVRSFRLLRFRSRLSVRTTAAMKTTLRSDLRARWRDRKNAMARQR
jgi:hypothetical protein